MAELSDVERDLLVAMSTDASSTLASADVAVLVGVSAAAAEAALWALVEEDLAEEITPGPEDRYAGRWSVVSHYALRDPSRASPRPRSRVLTVRPGGPGLFG